jgi:ectoine hydroxylase-related dioxygenase (phytanoyl-CoA dioxygenase family)
MALPNSTIDVDRYRTDGYLVVRSVLDEDELLACRNEIERLEKEFNAAPDAETAVRVLWHEPADGGTRRIKHIEPIIDVSEVFAQLARDRRVTAAAAAVFGDDVSLFEDKLIAKPPGGGGIPWHQDWSCCWRAHTDQLITCFVSLDDAGAENGALQVIAGTHLDRTCLPFADDGEFTAVVNPAETQRAVMPALRAGDMIVFDPYLLHHSDRNVSAHWRRTMIYTYGPAALGDLYHYDVSSGQVRWVDDIYEYEPDSGLKWVLRKPDAGRPEVAGWASQT